MFLDNRNITTEENTVDTNGAIVGQDNGASFPDEPFIGDAADGREPTTSFPDEPFIGDSDEGGTSFPDEPFIGDAADGREPTTSFPDEPFIGDSDEGGTSFPDEPFIGDAASPSGGFRPVIPNESLDGREPTTSDFQASGGWVWDGRRPTTDDPTGTAFVGSSGAIGEYDTEAVGGDGTVHLIGVNDLPDTGTFGEFG